MAGSFASMLASGNNNFKDISSPKKKKNSNNHCPRNMDDVLGQISKGYRVMVIMRGCPGSGKSYLAKMIVDKSYPSNPNYKQHIFSADEFFMINGVYCYEPLKLDDAHRFCQNNVMTKAREGYSPIIIDNTNMRLWEMDVYLKIGAENGYQLHIMEPLTPWRNSPVTLAKKNVHNVPEDKIRNMLKNYEPWTAGIAVLLKSLKLDHHLLSEPRKRHYPIIPSDNRAADEDRDENFMFQSLSRDDERNDEMEKVFTMPKSNDDGQWYHDWGKELCGEKSTKILDQPILEKISLPKPPRLDGNNGLNPFWLSSGVPVPMPDLTQIEPKDNWSVDFKNTDWIPHENEREGFWKASNDAGSTGSSTAEPKAKRKVRKIICLLLQ